MQTSVKTHRTKKTFRDTHAVHPELTAGADMLHNRERFQIRNTFTPLKTLVNLGNTSDLVQRFEDIDCWPGKRVQLFMQKGYTQSDVGSFSCYSQVYMAEV